MDYYLNESEKQVLQNWHAGLDDNRGDRARLRRADGPEDILLTSAFFHFLSPLPEKWRQEKNLLCSACVAGALAHVKTVNSKSKSFAQQLATPPEGKSRAPLSELRFQQLQKSPTLEDFYRRIIRAIRLLDGNVNIISLANDIRQWHQEFEKPFGKKPDQRLAVRWATEYFTALPKNSD
jgi:CRISPR system Cascade subunit CasB